MAQIYKHPLQTLLLQCLILLSIFHTGFAQSAGTAALPVSYNGPWAQANLPQGWSATGLSIDGADIAPSTTGGSAQFKKVGAQLLINFDNVDAKPVRLTYSLRAATTLASYSTEMTISTSEDGVAYSVVAVRGEQTNTAATTFTDVISTTAKYVKFELTGKSNANLLLDAVTLTASPYITSFVPAVGGPGEKVTITGNLFSGTTEVAFGNGIVSSVYNETDKTGFQVNADGTEIIAFVPNDATTGPVSVKVDASYTGKSNDDFIVQAPVLAIQSGITPTTGGVGTEVTVKGKYFTGVTSVAFNGVEARVFTIVSDTELRATVPVGASTGKIAVSSAAGTAVSYNDFTVPGPMLTANAGFSPQAGKAGTEVTISGQYLSGVTSVTFNGVAATIVENSNTDTEVKVLVPAGAADGPITVTTAAGSITSTDNFDFIPAPVIAGFTPVSGEAGTTVTITGENFSLGTASVTFAGADGTRLPAGVAGVTDTEITAQVPAGAVTGTIEVTTSEGGTTASAADFVIFQAPVNIAFTPVEGRPGDVLTITGSYLTGTSVVTFLGTEDGGVDDKDVASAEFVSISDSEIKVLVPTGAVAGKVAVTNPKGTAVSAADFTVLATPNILSFTPTSGIAKDMVVITGQNFTDASIVAFGGVEVTTAADASAETGFNVDDASQITAYVPAGAVTGPIAVTTPAGTATSANAFLIIQAPQITALNPTVGVAGDDVVLTGSNFTGATTITFVGAEADNTDDVTLAEADFTFVSDGEITFKVPAGAVTGAIAVENKAGSDKSAAFTVVTQPTIAGFTPASGRVGTAVTINGYLLANATSVEFATADAATTIPGAEFNLVDSKTITAKVPTGAVTGALKVAFADGTSITTTAEFTVVPAPSDISFNPATGVAGTEVVISGRNFAGITEVAFAGAANNTVDVTGATIATDASGLQSLTITVPAGAVTGPVKVTAGGETGESAAAFTVPAPEIASISSTTGYAYQPVTIKGFNFKNFSSVTFGGVEANIAGVAITTETVVDANNASITYDVITVPAPFDAGTGKIAVATVAGTGESTADFNVVEPTVTSITPEQGYADRTEVTITGTHFDEYFDSSTQSVLTQIPEVTFAGGINAAIVSATYSTTEDGEDVLKVVVPVKAVTGPIKIESLSGIGESAAFTLLLPEVLSFTPSAVYAGQAIEISGGNFVDVTDVFINGLSATSVDTSRATTEKVITALAPFDAGTGRIRVKSKSGSTISDSSITVLEPKITDVSPARQFAGINRTITITGSYFNEYFDQATGQVDVADPTVVFAGGVTGTIITKAYSNTESGEDVIEVEVPADALSGVIRIRSGSGIGQSQSSFEVLKAPEITSTSPAADIEGETVTVTGNYFVEVSKVTLNGADVTFAVVDEHTLTFTIPVGAEPGSLVVTNPAGASSPYSFRVIKKPLITDFADGTNDKEGPVGGTVTLTGQYLTDITSVTFAGLNGTRVTATVTSIDNNTGTSLGVTVPAGAITGTIEVENKAGLTATTTDYTVTTPMITAMAPNPARVATVVTIEGINLTDVGEVRFNGATTSQFYELGTDGKALEVRVPRGATTGKVTVVTLNGTATSTDNLVIIVPTITLSTYSMSFTASANTASEAQMYTVTGKNLESDITITAPNQFEVSLDNLTFSRTVTVAHDDATKNDDVVNASDEVYVRYAPTTADKFTAYVSNVSTNASTRYVTVSGNSVTVLPVELVSFDATLTGNRVNLNWTTASEKNSNRFEVEESKNAAKGFTKIGEVASKVGTSAVSTSYEFSHNITLNGITRYYRLKQVDFDGKYTYSKVIAVSTTANAQQFRVTVAPNPLEINSKMYIQAKESGRAQVRLYNTSGRQLLQKQIAVQQGQNEIELPLYEKLTTGIYILTVELNGQKRQFKVVKQ